MLTLENITKRFGDTVALEDVSLTVRDGEFVSILGASGSGKTTALRIVAGFLTPDAGVVRLDGRDITAMPVARRGFGFVFQNYALFPTKTVAQNIAFGLRVRNVDRRTVRRRIAELTELVGLAGLERRYPHELSGGQQQRVAIARAIAPAPRLLLLDEPLAALDARLRAELRRELRHLVKTLDVAAVYVTHDQTEALMLSDQVAVMREGRLAQVGPPEEIYRRPASRFVAEFVGVASFVDCAPDGAGRPRPSRGDPAFTLAIRPESVTLAKAAAAGEAWRAAVEDVLFLGYAWRVFLRLEDGQALAADVALHAWEAVRRDPRDLAVRFDPDDAIVVAGERRAHLESAIP